MASSRDSSAPSYFRRGARAGEFLPRGSVRSSWSDDRIPGPAVTGLLTLAAIEAAAIPVPGSRLVRIASELHSVARVRPILARHRLVRRGRRVALFEVALEQDGAEVGSARAYFAAPQPAPVNDIWEPGLDVRPPAPGAEPDLHSRLYFAEGVGWTGDGSLVPRESRKGLWIEGPELVAGEPMRGALLAGFASDGVNPVASWGTRGIRHINIDATLSLSREPRGEGIGLWADRVALGEGMLSASATVFDRHGPLGVATVTSIAQRTAVDPAQWRPATVRVLPNAD